MNTYDYHRRLSSLEVKYLQAKEIYAQAEENGMVMTKPHLERLKRERNFYLQEMIQAQYDLDNHLKRETETIKANQPQQTPIYETWGEFS